MLLRVHLQRGFYNVPKEFSGDCVLLWAVCLAVWPRQWVGITLLKHLVTQALPSDVREHQALIQEVRTFLMNTRLGNALG